MAVNFLSQNSKQNSVTVFKKWSRKGFAIFGSLGHVVHIGRLSVTLVQWIGQIVLNIDLVLKQTLMLESEEETDWDEINEELLLVLVRDTDTTVCAEKNVV